MPENTLYGDQFHARFGQFVLQNEVTGLGADYDKEKHDSNIAFLDSYQEGWGTPPYADIAKGWTLAHYGTHDPALAKQRAQEFSVDAHARAETAHRATKSSLGVLRTFIAKLPSEGRQKLDQNIDQRITQYAQQEGIDPSDLAFANWKSQEEREAGQPLTWTDWLSRTPAGEYDPNMTMKDRQLLNFVQWNQHVFNTTNTNPELRAGLKGHTDRLQSALHEAVNDGVLDEQLYKNMLHKPVVAVIGEPIDLGLLSAHGYTRPDEPEIILPQNYSIETFNHEMMHQYGGFPDKFWNESAAQLIADEIDGIQGAPLYESAYENGMKALRDMLTYADMGPRPLSKFFADRDYEGLLRELHDRTDIDFGRMYQDMKQQAMAAYPTDQVTGEQYLAHLMAKAVEDAIDTY